MPQLKMPHATTEDPACCNSKDLACCKQKIPHATVKVQMPQIKRSHILQLKILHATTKSSHMPQEIPHATTKIPHATTEIPHATTEIPHATTEIPNARKKRSYMPQQGSCMSHLKRSHIPQLKRCHKPQIKEPM